METNAITLAPNSIIIGSDAHKELFCRAFIDTHDPYDPHAMDWPVVPDEAVARLRAAFGDWVPGADAVPRRAGPAPPVEARRVLLVDKPDATQAQIRTGAIALPRNSPELLPAQVANTILGGGFSSRLIEELRIKRSLTYGASSGFVGRLTSGDFRMATFSKSPTTVETLELLLATEEQFRSTPIDPKALARSKAYLRGQFPLRVETPDALAARLAEIEFFGLPKDELETYRSRVDAVSPGTASQAAERWMPPPDRQAIVVVGPASRLRAPLEARYGTVQVVRPEDCERLAVRVSGD
jgi:zinc protease